MSTKLEIMNVAERAVRKNGYNGFSLDQIASEVGIQKSSIYYHFSSKAGLITAIFLRFSDQIISFLEYTERSERRAGDRLMAYIEETRALTEDGQSICLSIALNINQQSLDGEVVQELESFHRKNISWLIETFELGQRDGSIADIGDPAEEASACLALVDGAQLMARVHRDAKLYDAATRQLRSRIRLTPPSDTAQ